MPGDPTSTARPAQASTGERSVTETRTVAAEICADLRAGELLDVAFDRRTTRLDGRDRRWTQELLWGMLRRRAWLDAVLSDRVRGGIARLDPDLADLLRVGANQLLFMGSVPAYAAIAQTVELAKRRHGMGASKLANAVLRRLDRERAEVVVRTPTDPVESLALAYSHPRWLVARWVARWGAEQTEQLLAANNQEAPVIVRPFGLVSEQLEATLEAAGLHIQGAPLVRDSLHIGGAASLTELGAFRKGLFFMQDPASTLVTQYASISEGATVADLCSAPGGKALELTRSARVVVASDRSHHRLERVVSNIARMEARGVLPMVADAREPAIRPVDAVLVDVPCTGTGTFRRHPDARWRLKVSDLAVLGALQRAIIRAAATVVRPGGLMIYSTCSLEPEENDVQIESFLSESPSWVLEPPPPGAVPDAVIDAGRLRVLPQRHGTDGAFAARLRRVEG